MGLPPYTALSATAPSASGLNSPRWTTNNPPTKIPPQPHSQLLFLISLPPSFPSFSFVQNSISPSNFPFFLCYLCLLLLKILLFLLPTSALSVSSCKNSCCLFLLRFLFLDEFKSAPLGAHFFCLGLGFVCLFYSVQGFFFAEKSSDAENGRRYR